MINWEENKKQVQDLRVKRLKELKRQQTKEKALFIFILAFIIYIVITNIVNINTPELNECIKTKSEL